MTPLDDISCGELSGEDTICGLGESSLGLGESSQSPSSLRLSSMALCICFSSRFSSSFFSDDEVDWP